MDLINTIDQIDLEDLNILGMEMTRVCRDRHRLNPLDIAESDFKSKYRFTKPYYLKIDDLIRDDLTHDARGSPVSPELQVLCALRNWARHEIQDDTADLHGVSQPAVSKICKTVAVALARISHRFVKMPDTTGEQEANMRKFLSIANFPTVIGAIDCTHIKIKRINADGGQLYINRKGFPSINVQVICDADLRIIDIVTRWRGSVHDSRIFREIRIKQRFEAGAFPGLLLGDNTYPCTHYLFTPVLNPQTAKEQNYNRCHIKTRNTIERCFGLWKQRFRCLSRGMFGDIETAKKTIVACAVLHNIAIDMQENVFGDSTEPLYSETREERIVSQSTVRGNVRRMQFIETNF